MNRSLLILGLILAGSATSALAKGNDNDIKDTDGSQVVNQSTIRDHAQLDSTNYKDVLNGWSNPVADTKLDAKVSHNFVVNYAKRSQVGNVEIKDGISNSRGINTVNVNTGAQAIQQTGVSIAVVQHTSY